MRMSNHLFLLPLVFMCGCTITQEIEPSDISQGDVLCIIENKAVRAGFLQEFKYVLADHGVPYKIVAEHSVPDECEWTATYIGKWSWDLAIYLAYAEISVFHNGVLDGKAVYDSTSGGANMNKFVDGETKVRELVEELIQARAQTLK